MVHANKKVIMVNILANVMIIMWDLTVIFLNNVALILANMEAHALI